MKSFRAGRHAAVAVAALVSAWAGAIGAAEPTDKSTGQCRTVQANAGWQPTGISVGPGQFVCVAADGLWSHGEQGVQAITPFYGPEGFGKDEPNLVPEVVSRTGALIGRIGSNGAFLIERHLCFAPLSSGELSLSMNDVPGAFANNRGSLRVRIARWADARWAPGRIDLSAESCPAR